MSNVKRFRPQCLASAIVLVTASATASGQQSNGRTSAPSKEVAVSAIGSDSLAKLAAAAAAAPNNAAAWNRYGKAASDASRPEWRKTFTRVGPGKEMLTIAESSLARAVRLAPDNAQYVADLGAHLFGSSPTTASRVEKMLEPALAMAQRKGDSTGIAATADLLGVTTWRRYEDVADRRGSNVDPTLAAPGQQLPDATPGTSVSFSFLTDPKEFPKWLDLYTWPLKPPLGETLYKASEQYFRLARLADPSSESPVRHEFMVYLERDRWEEMSAAATARLSRNARQPWAWLGLGLAEHRLGHSAKAAAAFDSGFRRLPPEERARLTSVGRILTTRDAKWYAGLADSSRQKSDELFWSVGDPSMILPGNVFRSEFLARVVHAELRWTNEEQGVHGVDSDRGDVTVRFGPPPVRASFKFTSDTFPNVAWQYPALKLHFFFRQLPLYGTAQMASVYRTEIFEQVTHDNPSNWQNIPIMRHKLDSIQVQAARFRGPGDSTDVLVYAGVRNAILLEGHPNGSGTIDIGLFALGARGNVRAQEIKSTNSGERDTLMLKGVDWRIRLAPGTTALRVDALQPETMRAARWLADFPVVSQPGFSMSDVVVAEQIVPRGVRSSPVRWTDFDIQANPAGVYSRKHPLDVLWETYELAPSPTGHAYRLSISLQRQDARSAGAVIARIISGVTDAVGLTTRTNNGITIAFDKQAATSPVVTENIRLDLSGAPTGHYVLSVLVLDKVSGRTESASRSIILAN